MTKHNPEPQIQVSLADIRQVYDHLPSHSETNSRMMHPAVLAYVHDPENAANAAGQTFLERNNNVSIRTKQPLAVAADMIGADYKIFDLTPPERQTKPAAENDVALAMSYGMVTVEQGVDFVALIAIGQDSDKVLPQISSFDDIATHGAMNVAACYGAWLAARMAEIPVVCPGLLASCLERLAASEHCTASAIPDSGDLTEFSLSLIRRKALTSIV